MPRGGPEDGLARALQTRGVLVVFRPVAKEPDPHTHALFKKDRWKTVHVLPRRPDKPGDEYARRLITALSSEQVCVLAPGTKFDESGSRVGRGGGWFDRFFSVVPRMWLRIGVLSENNFSHTPLIRRLWDEPVDWLLIFNPKTKQWRVLETQARQRDL